MTAAVAPDEVIDFDAAEAFLKVARKAHEDGDRLHCAAACRLVVLALNLTEGPRVRSRTGHLK